MPKTKNLGLNLTDDLNNKFSDWRKSIDGNDDASKSNMQIIDDAFGDVSSILDEINGEVVE